MRRRGGESSEWVRRGYAQQRCGPHGDTALSSVLLLLFLTAATVSATRGAASASDATRCGCYSQRAAAAIACGD